MSFLLMINSNCFLEDAWVCDMQSIDIVKGMDTFNSDCDILGRICRLRLDRPSHKGTIETTSQACGQMLACASTCSLVPMMICFLFSVCNYCLINPPPTPTLLWIDIPPKISLLSFLLESPIAIRWPSAWGPLKEAWEIWPYHTEGQNASMTMEERLKDAANTFQQSPGLQAKHRLDEKIACGVFWTLCQGQALFLELSLKIVLAYCVSYDSLRSK